MLSKKQEEIIWEKNLGYLGMKIIQFYKNKNNPPLCQKSRVFISLVKDIMVLRNEDRENKKREKEDEA